jgi:hypothetical protein
MLFLLKFLKDINKRHLNILLHIHGKFVGQNDALAGICHHKIDTYDIVSFCSEWFLETYLIFFLSFLHYLRGVMFPKRVYTL